MVYRFYILLACVISTCVGCFYIGQDQYVDVVAHSSNEWSIRDAMTVIASPIGHNLFDPNNQNIHVFATPYFPSVILAIQRNAQQIKHWSELEFRANVDELLRDDLGMYCEWTSGRFVDSRGNYLKSPLQFDSLMFLITIENKGWPCTVPIVNAVIGQTPGGIPILGMHPIVSPADYPCHIPDITDLENHIYLVNEKHFYIKPTYVWGKRHDQLTSPETLFAMFKLKEGSYHFLAGSRQMYLGIKGLGEDIKLSFSLDMMR